LGANLPPSAPPSPGRRWRADLSSPSPWRAMERWADRAASPPCAARGGAAKPLNFRLRLPTSPSSWNPPSRPARAPRRRRWRFGAADRGTSTTP